MRRQPGFGGLAPAGSSRDERLDPFRLPARFAAGDPGADAGIRCIDITRHRVVLRRQLRGMRMAIGLPVTSFLGIALRIQKPTASGNGIEIVLAHSDPALSIRLYRGEQACDVIADWQAWSSVLGLPLLLAEAEGELREAFPRLGALRVGSPTWRRRRRSVISRRRPAILLRRKPGPPEPRNEHARQQAQGHRDQLTGIS